MAERVIQKFDLVRHYGFGKKNKYFIEDVLKTFWKKVRISEDEYSNIGIAVQDTSATLSAEIANYLVYQQLKSPNNIHYYRLQE